MLCHSINVMEVAPAWRRQLAPCVGARATGPVLPTAPVLLRPPQTSVMLAKAGQREGGSVSVWTQGREAVGGLGNRP